MDCGITFSRALCTSVISCANWDAVEGRIRLLEAWTGHAPVPCRIFSDCGLAFRLWVGFYHARVNCATRSLKWFRCWKSILPLESCKTCAPKRFLQNELLQWPCIKTRCLTQQAGCSRTNASACHLLGSSLLPSPRAIHGVAAGDARA